MREVRFVAAITIAVAPLWAAGFAGCGGDDEPTTAPATTAAGPATTPAEPEPEPADPAAKEDEGREEVLEKGDVPAPSEDAASPALSPEERRAVATVRHYVAALDARDGEGACAVLVDGALDAVKLPRDRGDCAGSLEASIGYADPRGLPVWDGAQVEAIASVETAGAEATVIPTVFTRFADRKEPSVEDDPIYLAKGDGGWRITKPSLTLYRAVGQEPPPEALVPP